MWTEFICYTTEIMAFMNIQVPYTVGQLASQDGLCSVSYLRSLVAYRFQPVYKNFITNKTKTLLRTKQNIWKKIFQAKNYVAEDWVSIYIRTIPK